MSKYLILLIVLFSSTITKAQISEPKNILFFVYDGIEILDFTGPMEVLAAAGFRIYTVGDKDTIVSRGILKIIPDYNFTKTKDYPKPDIVAVFGGSAHMQWQNKTYQEFLKEITNQSEINFSVCDGAFWFGGIGLLDDKSSTTYHWLVSELQKQFPRTKTFEKVKYVDNGNLITSAGVSAGIDAAFYLVSKLKGNAFTQQIAERIEYDHWKPGMGKIVESNVINNAKNMGFLSIQNEVQELYKGELLNLAEWFLAKGKTNDANACINHVMNNYTSNEMDYSLAAKILQAKKVKDAPLTKVQFTELVMQGDIKRAEEVFRKTKVTYPNWQYVNRDDLLYIGYYSFQNTNQWDKAIEIYKLNHKIFPEYFHCLAYIAEIYALKNDYSTAISYFEQAMSKTSTEKEKQYFVRRISELNEKKGIR
jgi:transcriptional regulator GlxA family with amidase domain